MATPTPQHVNPAQIVRWVDADTVVLNTKLDFYISHGPSKHRLLWVNAYEKNTDLGQQAIAYVNRIAPPGSWVTIRTYKVEGDSDDFGRFLTEIFTGPLNLNQELLKAGFAWPYMVPK